MQKKRSWIRSNTTVRVVLGILSLCIIFVGLKASLSGDLSYENYWGGLVFGPLAILLGAAGLVGTIFMWRKLNRKQRQQKGHAARKARKAARYRSAVEDFDKPWRGGL